MSNGTLIHQRTLKVASLKPHPRNAEIYGDPRESQDFGAFVQDVAENGIHPLIVADDMTIIGGHRRYYAALQLGIAEVDATVYHYADEIDKLAALIADNNQRVKANWQMGEEAAALVEIATLRAKMRQIRKPADSVKEPVPQQNGQARDFVGAQLGVSGRTVSDMLKVKAAVEEMEEAGADDEAAALRELMNRSVKAAAKEVKTRTQAPRQATTYTVEEWQLLTKQSQAVILSERSDSTFNQTNDNIEWAAWSWNPVTGCLHDCDYCYARDIAVRFFPQKFVPSFLPERLSAPSNTKAPDVSNVTDPARRLALGNVFVCSMADLFGKWVPAEWIEAVLQQAWDNPQWTFLFLTKFPIRMADFEFPPNSWIGTTVDRQWAVERAEKAFRKVRSSGYQGVAWLSCEPMMERLTFSSLDMFDWVVMGGASKSTQTPEFKPDWEWKVHLWLQAKAAELPVYMKTNFGVEPRVREYPQRLQEAQ